MRYLRLQVIMDVVSPDMAKPAGRYNMMAKTRCDDHFMARTMHDLLELMRQVGSCRLVVERVACARRAKLCAKARRQGTGARSLVWPACP
jgi:hypothetical protein